MPKKATSPSKREPITPAHYRAFQRAYDFFNKELFGGTLPHVMVTLQRRAGSRGYFAPDRFVGRIQDAAAHELAMNPDKFIGRTDEEILSTLAHEMAHVWQEEHGTPSRRGYHNREWAAKMKEIGLQPSDTAAPNGRETGQMVSHYIIPNGRYAKAYATLQAEGVRLHWQSGAGCDQQGRAGKTAGKQANAKQASKTKYTCLDCGQNAWAKPDTLLICGTCYEDDDNDVVLMLAAPDEGDS